MHDYVKQLHETLEAHSDKEKAEGMSKYMKNRFAFLGISKPQRAELQKHFLAACKLLPMNELHEIALELWDMNEREYQYVCMEMLQSNKKKWNEDSLQLFVKLVALKSWWDSVDMIASNLIGMYCLPTHAKHVPTMQAFSKDENMWYNRVAVIHQLKYKQHTNEDLLVEVIYNCMHKNEFFIQKAIGWALRQYAYTRPDFVKRFVETNTLSNLAKREALKRIQTT